MLAYKALYKSKLLLLLCIYYICILILICIIIGALRNLFVGALNKLKFIIIIMPNNFLNYTEYLRPIVLAQRGCFCDISQFSAITIQFVAEIEKVRYIYTLQSSQLVPTANGDNLLKRKVCAFFASKFDKNMQYFTQYTICNTFLQKHSCRV